MAPPAGELGVIEDAVALLEEGGLVLHPTETVYGIGGLLEGPSTARLRRAKGRTSGGFVMLVPGSRHLGGLLGEAGSALADAFWPGPLTLVCDDPEGRFPEAVKAWDGSVAVRVCGHEVTRALVTRLGRPITSTSANLPGQAPGKTLAAGLEAVRALGLECLALDGGTLPGSPPSTIVDIRGRGWRVIRDGAIAASDLTAAMQGQPWDQEGS